MLRRIDPRAVQLGMFIQAFDGGWLAHPFWRSHFHLTDPDDLARVRHSKVRAVVIDDAKTMQPRAGAYASPRPAEAAHARGGRAAQTGSTRHRVQTSVPGAAPSPAISSSAISSSAAAERAEIARVLNASAQRIRQAFAGVANGAPLVLDQLGDVIDDISAAMHRNHELMIGISRLKSKDEYTFLHSVSVGALMIGMGRELGLDPAEVRELGIGGLVHDVGKMTIANAILNKPGPLTDAEFGRMKAHPEAGHRILLQDGVVSPIALEVTLRHHERIDGTGYPGGLSGDDVSLYARIAAICDVFDALTSARAYKSAMPAHDAIALMDRQEGHFDRALLVTFMRSIGLYPAGLVVRLSSDRIGIIIPPGNKPGRPRARAFHCANTDRPLDWSDVVISDRGQGERVIAEANPTDWAIDDWAGLCQRLLAGRSPVAA